MRARLVVAVVLVLTAVYAWGLGWIAWGFARAGGTVGWGLAGAVVILLALTVWVTWREVMFGLAARRADDDFAHQLEQARAAGTEVAFRPLVEEDPRTEFAAAREAMADREEDWRAWFRLSLAYDACRDRRQARAAMRTAIRLREPGSAHAPAR